MKIEEGKYYKTRGGEKVGPMRKNDDCFWSWVGRAYGCELDLTYTHEGFAFDQDEPCDDDLVEEWAEPQPNDTKHFTAMLAEVGRIAADYGYEVDSVRAFTGSGGGKVVNLTMCEVKE